MDIKSVYVKIAAILTTLFETGGSPESILYLGIGADINEWGLLRDVMHKGGLIEVKAHYVTLTSLGSSKAIELNKLVAN